MAEVIEIACHCNEYRATADPGSCVCGHARGEHSDGYCFHDSTLDPLATLDQRQTPPHQD